MQPQKTSVDPILLTLVGILVFGGFLVFTSAALGLLAREGAAFENVAFNQFFFGIIGGGLALLLCSTIHYRHWRKFAFYVFLATSLMAAAVYIPGIGFTYGGATRWISMGGFSLQPAEFLKIGFIIYLATWLSGVYRHINTFRRGTLPFLGLLAIPGIILLGQPDTDSFVIIAVAATAMFLVAGGRWRDIFLLGLLGVILVAALAFSRPYVMDRLTSFMDPSLDPQGAGYQISQSLIAIGSGGVTGRGFGQSVQKFGYLPEPIGDSIFAVYAEEFGFVGTFILIILLSIFTFRGYRLATEARDLFGMLLVVGIMTFIVFQAFLNIASIVGLVPIAGIPLPFISHGGTALLATLGAVGIVLNVSKYRTRRS